MRVRSESSLRSGLNGGSNPQRVPFPLPAPPIHGSREVSWDQPLPAPRFVTIFRNPWFHLGAAAALVVALAFALGALQRKARPEAAPSGTGGEAPSLVVFCAAGLKPALEPLLQDYESRYHVPILVQYGGSGTLLSNLQVARSGDLFLSGDAGTLETARAKGLVAEILPLARQRPVIAVGKGNPKAIRTPADLTRPGVRLALANPEAASIGKLSRQLLAAAGLWERVEERVRTDGVFKPTVGEVANDLKLRTVDAGIIWDATARQYPEIESVPVPAFESAVEEVQASVLTCTAQPTAALRLARFLNSREGNAGFRARGFEPVDGDAWEWAPEITFYCGSVNRRAVEQVIKAFEQREGITINTIYNGCGILTAQMRTIDQKGGAGFPDVYMACDRYYLENVQNWFQEDRDLSDARIVVAVPKGNPKGLQTLSDLAKPGVRVAVGQPEQCTIGALTRILLQQEKLYDAVMANVVLQTASSAMLVPSVVTRSVDAAIAYNTDTRAEAAQIDVLAIDSPRALAIQPFSIARSSDFKCLGRRLFETLRNSRADFEAAGFHFRGGTGPGAATPGTP